MGGAVFPSIYLTRGQTTVEVMKIMVTSFSRSHACTAALSAALCAWDLLKEVSVIFITSTTLCPQVKGANKEGTMHHPSTENWIVDLLSRIPPIRTRPRFPYRHSLPSGNFYKPLILICQRTDRVKTTITEN